MRILVVGPTSRPAAEVAAEVAADLVRLASAGVDVTYRTTGAGPSHVRTVDDAVAAGPHVVEAVVQAAADGFDAVVVDCTDDPGVGAARRAVPIPVVGAGEALRRAAAASPGPVRYVGPDELRSLAPGESPEVGDTRTVALGATGWSDVAAALRAPRPDLVVLDPLDVAVAACLAALR